CKALIAHIHAESENCKHPRIDAMTPYSNTQVYMFNGDNFWIVDTCSVQQVESTKRKIKDYWPHVQTPVDAVSNFYDSSNSTFLIFITKNVYKMYRHKVDAPLIQNDTLYRFGNIRMRGLTKGNGRINALHINQNKEAFVCSSRNNLSKCAIEDKFVLEF
ncbi:hypothetical protein B4U80_14661, partial [Leptotrombidium deliense]